MAVQILFVQSEKEAVANKLIYSYVRNEAKATCTW